jgi:hypothetical protein
MRLPLLVLGVVFLARFNAPPVCAAELFEETSKDFGSVPRGTTLIHQFRLKNTRNHSLHVAGLRTSCGCATAALGRDDIAPGQSTVLQVTIDTRKYSGARVFTIHVLFDRPAVEEVRVTVTATSRDDVTLTPGQLEFGRVKRGTPAKATVTIEYHGTANWQITGVENDNGYLKPDVQHIAAGLGQTIYQLTVTLRPDIPAGAWHSDLWLKTSDAVTPRIRVPLVVEVESTLTATPNDVQLGTVQAGRQAERKVVIRGPAPFKIAKIEGEDGQFQIGGRSDEAKAVHVLKVTFLAKDCVGEVARTFRVHTDLADGETLHFSAHSMVVP